MTTVLIRCSFSKLRRSGSRSPQVNQLLHSLETYGAQICFVVSLLESDECLSLLSGNRVPGADVSGSFDLVDECALSITELEMGNRTIIECSHFYSFDGPVLREFK